MRLGNRWEEGITWDTAVPVLAGCSVGAENLGFLCVLPYVSIVHIAGHAKMKLIKPNPNEAKRAT
jgi:hypothetical protein